MKKRLNSYAGTLWCGSLLALSLGFSAWTGCSPRSDQAAASGNEGSPKTIPILATTTMVADLARQVGGDRVNVAGLMGPGVDPHLYKPAASDVVKLEKARVVFYSGLMLEGHLTDLFVRMEKKGKAVVPVTQDIPEDRLIQPEGMEKLWDPHVWGDPKLWILCLETVSRVLIEVDPEGRAYFEERTLSYRTELEALDQWAAGRLKEIPDSHRILITSHDAFSYFGRSYGFQVIGIQGISTVSQPGLADITKMVDLIRERQIPAVFLETSIAPATIERVSQDAGVVVGGELYSDALGTPGQMETVGGETYDVGTYIGMIRHNVNTVVEALK